MTNSSSKQLQTESLKSVMTVRFLINSQLMMNTLNGKKKTKYKPGTIFGDWTIVQTGAMVETPFNTFENAFVIEMNNADFVNRKYFVRGFGEVKRESVMTMDDGEFIVTSTLESIE